MLRLSLLPNLMAFDSLENHFMAFNMQIISTKVCYTHTSSPRHTHTHTCSETARRISNAKVAAAFEVARIIF